MLSSAKNYANRKFEIVYRNERHKTLKLECEKVSERNGWYEAIKRTISQAKEMRSAWTRSSNQLATKYVEYPDDDSDEEQRTLEVENKSGVDEDNMLEQFDDPYDVRYAETSNFRIQRFKMIDPMDDNMSQTSEQDEAYNEERRNNKNLVRTSSQLSPFDKPKCVPRESDSVTVRSPGNSNMKRRSGRNSVPKDFAKVAPYKEEIEEDDSFEFFDKRPKPERQKPECQKPEREKTGVIRRSSKNLESRSPSLKIRLDDF